MELQLLGKHVLIAEIIPQAGQRRSVVECECAQPAVFAEINGQVTGEAGTATIADKHDLVAGVVDRMCRGPDLRERII